MRETNRSEVRAQDAMAVSHIAARKRDEITPQGVEGDRTKAARPTHSCTYAGNLPYTVYTPSRRRMRPRRCAQEGHGKVHEEGEDEEEAGNCVVYQASWTGPTRRPRRVRMEPTGTASWRRSGLSGGR
ncbi:unnamed protein product [Prorocentrum cordatum]|uniref:Uncharacterized protein n=1 Tax=Prorocentrum cordatum TaxID=2364126 RepID=A0ABN9WFA2_9DINO|nr:unnamed protein product [Polarella glacialis]